MGELEYKTKFYILNNAYDRAVQLLYQQSTGVEGEEGFFSQKSIIFYLDLEKTRAVKISSKKCFGFLRRVELSDKVDANLIGKILKTSEDNYKK